MKLLEKNMVRIAAIQAGACTEDLDKNIEDNLLLLDEAAKNNPDFVVYSELSTVPYFAGTYDPRFFDLADTIPGKITKAFGEKAKEYNTTVIVTFFERTLEGEFYNSAVVIGPDGKVIPGLLHDGRTMPCARKAHLPTLFDEQKQTARNNEKFYYKPGQGFPIFHTEKAPIGILICWDKRFTEAWRILALQGAQIIFNPIATWGSLRTTMFESEMRTMGMYNQTFVVGTAKKGTEFVEQERVFGGGAIIADPFGQVVAKSTGDNSVLIADIDLALWMKARTYSPVGRDRRPELYKLLIEK